MRFTFSPHNAAPVTATFEVAGLGELLAPIAKRCGAELQIADCRFRLQIADLTTLTNYAGFVIRRRAP